MRLSLLALIVIWVHLTTSCGPAPDDEATTERYVALMNEGVGMMGRFDFEAAGRFFEEALELRPKSTQAALDRAISVLNRTETGSQSQALDLLDRILQKDPRDFRAPVPEG